MNKYKNKDTYNIEPINSIYLDDNCTKGCEYTKRPIYECMNDFQLFVHEFRTSVTKIIKLNITSSELIKFFMQFIPMHFNAKIYGDNVMATLSNTELIPCINVIFNKIEEYNKFVMSLMFIFTHDLLCYELHNKKYYDLTHLLKDNPRINNYCPCMINYISEYNCPIHTKYFKLRIKNITLKFVLEGSKGGYEGGYDYIDKYKYFNELCITWQKIHNKLNYSLIKDFSDTQQAISLTIIKENLLNKKLTIRDSKLKTYENAKKIIYMLKLYSKYILKGYNVELHSQLKVNLILNIYCLSDIKNIINDIICFDIGFIIYEYLTIGNKQTCKLCKQRFINPDCIIAISCLCKQTTEYCHIECLKEVTYVIVDGYILCKECNESISLGEYNTETIYDELENKENSLIDEDLNINKFLKCDNNLLKNETCNAYLKVNSNRTYADVLKTNLKKKIYKI